MLGENLISATMFCLFRHSSDSARISLADLAAPRLATRSARRRAGPDASTDWRDSIYYPEKKCDMYYIISLKSLARFVVIAIVLTCK